MAESHRRDLISPADTAGQFLSADRSSFIGVAGKCIYEGLLSPVAYEGVGGSGGQNTDCSYKFFRAEVMP